MYLLTSEAALALASELTRAVVSAERTRRERAEAAYPMVEHRELIARAAALSETAIECRDETGETWTTTIGAFVSDNYESIGDDELHALITGDSVTMFSNCGPFEIRRAGAVAS